LNILSKYFSTERFKDLCKLSLVKFANDGLFFRLEPILLLPSCFKKDDSFKNGQKVLKKSSHIASLNP